MILKAFLGFRNRRPQFHWSKDAGTCMRVMLQEEREMMSEPLSIIGDMETYARYPPKSYLLFLRSRQAKNR